MVVILFLLAMAFLACIVFLLLMSFKQQQKIEKLQQAVYKADALEANLKQTLEITQDLVKKMHVQQQALDFTTQKLHNVELQNAELVKIVTQLAQR
jgi:sensor domain CHASE-containing protein